ncbi:MAG: CarD family transcriptional regulator, partial [Alphaproteobacteria bacterium]|nr:CarD family transcriptional regulator [Alphaproteobacteria bacterium]
SRLRSARPPHDGVIPNFKTNDMVSHPYHGIGRVVSVKRERIGDQNVPMVAVAYDGERMVLRIPMASVPDQGLRPIATESMMTKVRAVLLGKPRVRRAMWSRRAQEYESKINSGDPLAVAEVARELWRDESQPESSFSERQMYQRAIRRLGSERAAIDGSDLDTAIEKLEKVLRSTLRAETAKS